MTIEATLERIAVALEAIAAGGGTVTAEKAEPAAEKPKRTRRSSKSSTSKESKPESSSTTAPEKSEESPDEEVKIEAVREALTRLQKAVNGGAARKVLATVGGDGALSKVKPAKYQAVIDEANRQAAEAEGE